MAGAALAAVPIIIVFLAFQKYFTKGITMGAVTVSYTHLLEGMTHVRFLDANTLPGAGCSDVDGMHMTLEAHKVLAEALQKELTGSTL